ncbi:MAG: hypothetical protein J6B34_06045 [Clostridia bacterium]|nr:hypothetical protein [Clostridia bacterium]
MKKNISYNFKLNEEMARKLSHVAKSEGMTIQNLINSLVRQKVQYFERVKGNIKKQELDLVDLTEFDISEH